LVELDDHVVGPQLAADLFARDELARVFQKKGEDSKGLLLQLDREPLLAELSRAKVEFEDSETKDPRGSELLFQDLPIAKSD